MAKALLGHVNSDVRTTAVLTVEHQRLRRRVADLEALVLRLQAENDRLAAAERDARESAREARDLQHRLTAGLIFGCAGARPAAARSSPS